MTVRSSAAFLSAFGAGALRRELSERNLARVWPGAEGLACEQTFGTVPSVVYVPEEGGRSHGNFLDASYRRILANASWRARLEKAYTGGRRIARSADRAGRAELDCANSSDALLMNVFCYPRVLLRPGLRSLLALEAAGTAAEFGVRIGVPLREVGKRGRSASVVDRTEVDLRLGDLLLEAKLTESDFQTAPARLVLRYRDLDEVFDAEELPRSAGGGFASYQLVRGALLAHAYEARFAVLVDGRRIDLREQWFRVLCAVRSAELRSRLQLFTWQELAETVSEPLQRFLKVKYGIVRP